ncbi:UDP-glucose 4-epimerase GalE [Akkermansiaceae bacterium]|nr:UDP-glucose 4-epimerase GalE [Akkermansiaceae bacterium]MDB0056860.1 UDP-glucose 4-epimerase GalE [Akkermansiaceae bacterium]MDB4282176.1 UDP-glucose 4-epimerase GalE [Akkermansiaceae bacterium]MDB4310011.1 UDP-glucose 4-epimerase GalE [Akkermansiaceae bacterium]MDB4804680.1 UDP-glucose 4-epimerase GalE [Akkermansiaceae bacterium]
MRILVTGGAGYIGSHTVRELVSQGWEVVVIDNLVYGHREAIVDPSVVLLEGSLDDPKILDQAFAKKVDIVVHFAAYAYVGESVEDPLKYYQNNLAAPIALLSRMQHENCKQFVFSSTCATYGIPETCPIDESFPQEPINPYGESKLMLEKVLRDCETAWGLRSIFLRYFNAAGCSLDGVIGEDHDPETHLIPLVIAAALGKRKSIKVFGSDYPTPDGTCVRDYIHVLDLASAHSKAISYLTNGGVTTAVNLGTGVPISVKEIIAGVEKVTGKKVPVEQVDRRAGDPPELLADPSRANELLGWQPRHSDLKTILESAYQWSSSPRNGSYSN